VYITFTIAKHYDDNLKPILIFSIQNSK